MHRLDISPGTHYNKSIRNSGNCPKLFERNLIYEIDLYLPYCGAKSFNPLKKAFTGGLHTKGKVCMECGQHCVNGKASMIFSAVVYIAAWCW